MDVLELLQVEAGLADLVFTQFSQESGLLLQFAVQVEDEILLAGGETDRKPVAPGRFATVVKIAEADDGFPPHDGRIPGKFLHQIQNGQTISPPLLIRDAGKIPVDAGGVLLCFPFSHRGVLRRGIKIGLPDLLGAFRFMASSFSQPTRGRSEVATPIRQCRCLAIQS